MVEAHCLGPCVAWPSRATATAYSSCRALPPHLQVRGTLRGMIGDLGRCSKVGSSAGHQVQPICGLPVTCSARARVGATDEARTEMQTSGIQAIGVRSEADVPRSDIQCCSCVRPHVVAMLFAMFAPLVWLHSWPVSLSRLEAYLNDHNRNLSRATFDAHHKRFSSTKMPLLSELVDESYDV